MHTAGSTVYSTSQAGVRVTLINTSLAVQPLISSAITIAGVVEKGILHEERAFKRTLLYLMKRRRQP